MQISIKREIALVAEVLVAPVGCIAFVEWNYLTGHNYETVTVWIYGMLQAAATAFLLAQPGWAFWKRCACAFVLSCLSALAATFGAMMVSVAKGDGL